MKLKYIFAVGVMALLASCDESRFLDCSGYLFTPMGQP